MNKVICMPAGWGKHRKFTSLQKKLGARGVGVFVMLQDFVVENGDAEWGFDFKEEGPDSLEFFAEEVGEEKAFLLAVIGMAEKAEMVEFDGSRIVFVKAKKTTEDCLAALARNRGVSDSKAEISQAASKLAPNSSVSVNRGPAEANERICTYPPDPSSNVTLRYVTNEVSTLAPSGADSLEAASRDLLEKEQRNATLRSENLEGFDCTLDELTQDLGFGGAKPEKVMENEAGMVLKFNASMRNKVSELTSQHGDEAFHGAFRVYIHEQRTKPLAAYDPKSRVVVFLGCFAEKLSLFKDLTGDYGPRRVNISHDQDMLPEPPRRQEPLRLPALSVTELEWPMSIKPKMLRGVSKSWAQMKCEEGLLDQEWPVYREAYGPDPDNETQEGLNARARRAWKAVEEFRKTQPDPLFAGLDSVHGETTPPSGKVH